MEHIEQRPDRRLHPPWHPWEALPLGLTITVATFLAAIGIAVAFDGRGGSARIVMALASQVAFAGITIGWVSVRHPGTLPQLGLRSRRASGDLAIGAWVGAGLFGASIFLVVPAIFVVVRLITGSSPGPLDQQILPLDPSLPQLALGMVAVVIGAPVGEELFFRGFLFGSLRGRLGFPRAAVISAAVFGLFHLQPPLGAADVVLILVMFFVGLGLATLYHRRGSLVAPMAAHAMFNIIGYTLIVMEA